MWRPPFSGEDEEPMWAALKGARKTRTRRNGKFQVTFVEGSSRFWVLLSSAHAQGQRPTQPTKRLRSALGSRNPVPYPTLSRSDGHRVPRAARSRTPGDPRDGPRGPDPRRRGRPPGRGGTRGPRRAGRGLDRAGRGTLGHPARRRRGEPRRARVRLGEGAEWPAPEGARKRATTCTA